MDREHEIKPAEGSPYGKMSLDRGPDEGQAGDGPVEYDAVPLHNDSPIDRMTKEQLRDALRGIIDAVPTDAIHEAKPNRNGEHPTMKPVRLFARLIRNSTRPGETVLDPFAGSGTTVVACEGMGRRARVMELDPRYCDVILERWERMTGKTAERVG